MLGFIHARQPRSHDRKALYEFQHVLGVGGFGTVKLVKRKADGAPFACKIVNKKDVVHMQHQIDIMNLVVQLDHPRVVKMHEWFESNSRFYMIFELCLGGELFDHLFEQGRGFSEKKARRMTHALLCGVEYIHSRNIIHRDIKPENLLCRTKWDDSDDDAVGNPLDFAISDFGLGLKLRDGETVNEIAGSPAYAAPEAMNGSSYSYSADMWSVGIFIFVCLACRFPFESLEAKDILREAQSTPIRFPPNPWKVVSADAIDLIRKLLVVEPSERLTAKQALAHPWFYRLHESPISGTPSGVATPVDGPTATLARQPTIALPRALQARTF